ncbi:MAG TPA: glycoside hydrolase family 28 protein [Candidatus Sulfotelmatobacter sp.]|nr:glycoside hydrolase family 28 protein [Candidatus Sulfotelmatobacter sp.]
MGKRQGTRRDLLAWAPVLGLCADVPVRAAQKVGSVQEGSLGFNVRDFGATGDGATLDTLSINKAIAAVSKIGGGTVHFPAGIYLCHSIHLKSNIRLEFTNGVVIVAADPPKNNGEEGYDLTEPNEPGEKFQDFGHSHCHNSLIWGEDLENVSICGPGLIWGRGISRGEFQGPIAEIPGVANKTIALKNCHDVILRDFSILHGGHFGILTTGVDNLTIDNVKIDTNRAGIDMDCCRNVRVTNCSVNAPWDDAICVKSSYALGLPRAAEMITISNCMVSGSFEEGSLLDGTLKRFPPDADIDRNGRIKLGTESSGGFRNITISNCVFDGCFGLAILSVDGAIIEDVSISNISMRDTVASPIFIRLGSRMRSPAGAQIGAIRRINISNIVSSSTSSLMCSMIAGIPDHTIESIKLTGILLQHSGGGTTIDASRHLEELEKEYPEPTMFGNTPAHGFFIRHAKDIEISNCKVIATSEDARPCFFLDDVAKTTFSDIRTYGATTSPLFVLENVKNIRVAKCNSLPDTEIADAKHTEL